MQAHAAELVLKKLHSRMLLEAVQTRLIAAPMVRAVEARIVVEVTYKVTLAELSS